MEENVTLGEGGLPTTDTELDFSFPWPWHIVSTSWTPIANASPTDCHWQKHVHHTLEVTALTTAATIILLLNLIQPRSKKQCQPHTLWSLLDVVSPVRFIGGTPLRYMYCLVMSCWGADVVQDLLNKSLYYRSDYGIIDVFKVYALSPTVIILKEALAYFPVLACVDAPVRVVGYCVGFFYTLLLGVYKIDIEAIRIMGCSYFGEQTNKEIGVSLAVHIPVYLGYLVSAVWFFCHAMIELTLLIFTRSSLKTHARDYDEYTDYINHVKHLLKRPMKLARGRRVLRTDTLWNYLVRGFKYVLPYQSTFIYPLPFLAGMCMSWTIVYQLSISVMYKEVHLSNKMMDFITGFNITVETIKDILPSLSYRLDDMFYDAKSFAEAYLIILPFSSSIAFGLCAFFVMYMTQTFHKHLRNAYKGDIYPLVKSQPLPSPTYRLAATMRFTAFLISHFLFSWALYTVALAALLTIGLLFYYLFKDAQFFGIHFWAFFMIPMMWSTLMHHLQLVLCRWVFNDKTGGEDLVKIRYKQLYDVLIYVFMFFNVIFGFVMCFLRIFGVFIFTCVMLFRIDWDVYMRGLEGWDMGNRTYVGYMYTEITINNAVVRVFLKILQDAVDKKDPLSLPIRAEARLQINNHHRSSPISNSPCSDDERTPLMVNASALYHTSSGEYSSSMSRGSSLARKRWLLAYTLLRNPSLRQLTAYNLSTENEDQAFDYQPETLNKTDVQFCT